MEFWLGQLAGPWTQGLRPGRDAPEKGPGRARTRAQAGALGPGPRLGQDWEVAGQARTRPAWDEPVKEPAGKDQARMDILLCAYYLCMWLTLRSN